MGINMLEVKNEGIVLRKRGLEFEKKAVLNPTCVMEGKKTHLFYRAVDGNDVSRVGYAIVTGTKVISRLDYPLMEPEHDYERRGIEDPRVTKLEEDYYMVYVALDELANARLALAQSINLKIWEKKGLIGPNITYDETRKIIDRRALCLGYRYFLDYFWKSGGRNAFLFEKSACLFPRRIRGKIAMLHRIHPGIQVVYADNFPELKENSFWREYLAHLGDYIVMNPRLLWEGEVIGAGSTPIETDNGWLVIYYGSTKIPGGRMFRAGAALWSLDDPRQEIGRLKQPLFEPEEEWERKGRVNNVVFPSGAVVRGDRLWIYYGAADMMIGARSVDIEQLLSEIKRGKMRQ